MIKEVLYAFKLRQKLKKHNTRLRSYHISKNVDIGEWCSVAKRTKLGDNVKVGDFTYFNADKYWITVESNVNIGKYCSIAPGVHIGAGNHNVSYVTTHPILFDKYYLNALGSEAKQQALGLIDTDVKTSIGNDVWIGLGAIIKRGVTIGNGAVIAGGSVVVKDVPPYAIVGGNPAKVIRMRTGEDNIAFFEENEKSMWWNWPREELSENLEKLYDFETYREFLNKKI